MKRGRTALKAVLIIAAVILLGLVQAGFFDRLKLFGCKPELVLCFVAVVSLRLNTLWAGVAGFLAGFYIDAVYGRYLGVYALLYLIVCVLLSALGRRVMAKHNWLGMLLLPPVFLLHEMAESLLIRFIAMYVAGGGPLYHYAYAEHFMVRILPGALYNLGVALLFFLILLLSLRLRRPKPAINYRNERDVVIDNAQ